jgi:hypothetical protein
MCRSSQATLAALGATAGATGLLAARAEDDALAGAALAPAALAALVVFGVVALVIAVRRARAVTERRTRTGLVTAIVLGVVAAAAWAALAAAATGAPRALRLHQAALARPGAAVALVGMAAALALARRPAVRWAALACAVLAALPIVAGSRSFLLRFARDPFLAHPEPLATRTAAARPVRETRIGSGAAQLRLSPSWSRFAVRAMETGGADDEPRPSARLSVRSFSGPEREVEAEDLRFLNDLRVLALVRVPAGLELRAVSLDDAQDVSWSQAIPDVRGPRLELDTGLGLWRVSGMDAESRAAVVIVGRINEDGFEARRWPLLDPGGGAALPPVASAQAALAVRLQMDGAAWPALALAGGTPVPLRSELWALGPEGARLLGTSGLELRCAEPPIEHADPTFVCVAWDGRRTLFWTVNAKTGGLTPIGSFDGRIEALLPAPLGRLVGWADEGLVWVDPARRELSRVRLPADAARPSELAPGSESFGALATAPDGAIVTVYQVEPGE